MLKLRERLAAAPQMEEPRMEARGTDTPAQASHAYQQMKARVHQLLLGRLDLEAMEGMTAERLREELNVMVERLLNEENVVVNAQERRSLVRDIQHEMLGLGPLEPLLAWATLRVVSAGAP